MTRYPGKLKLIGAGLERGREREVPDDSLSGEVETLLRG